MNKKHASGILSPLRLPVSPSRPWEGYRFQYRMGKFAMVAALVPQVSAENRGAILGTGQTLSHPAAPHLNSRLWQFSFSYSCIAAPVSPAEAGSRHSLIARERRAKARLYLMPEQLQ